MNSSPCWYHSTLIIGFEQFNPLSHFGSYRAALENYGRKFVRMNLQAMTAKQDYLLEHEVIKCSLRLSANSIGLGGDWGSPKSLALLKIVSDIRPDIITKKEYQEFQYQSRSKGDTHCVEKLAQTKLINLFAVHNIEYLTYKNEVEDRQSTSICVVNPKIIQVKKRFHFSAEEIVNSVKSSENYQELRQTDFIDNLLGLVLQRQG